MPIKEKCRQSVFLWYDWGMTNQESNRDQIVALFQDGVIDAEYLIIAMAKWMSQDEAGEFLEANMLDAASMAADEEEN